MLRAVDCMGNLSLEKGGCIGFRPSRTLRPWHSRRRADLVLRYLPRLFLLVITVLRPPVQLAGQG